MIVVRDTMHLKFGKMKEAKAVLKEFSPLMMEISTAPTRFLVDFTGESYRLIFESTYDSLAAYEAELKRLFAHPGWGSWYPRFVPLIETSFREILTVIEI